tara:strand:+ start:1877 stop:2377 length:501 start_codon:yes stop_codon:yes gene_type:complete
MNNILNKIEKRILINKYSKIYVLIFLMLFFSIIYMLLEDNHFEGVNKFKEIVKEEVIKDKVQEKIKESFNNLNNYYENNKIINSKKELKQEKIIEKATKEGEKETETQELDTANVNPSLTNKYLNRLYFSIITGCLLGYGDIYPVTNISKIITSIQGLLTIILIIY